MFMIFVETGPDDQDDVDNEFFTAALKEMVSLGIDIARIIHQQIVAQSVDSPHSPIPEPTSLAFERVSRAVRRSIMLAKKLRELPKKPSPACGRGLSEGPTRASSAPMTDPKERPDRPDSPDRLETLDDRPTIDLINEIRQDLDLPPLPARKHAAGKKSPEQRDEGQRQELSAPTTNPTPQRAVPWHQPELPNPATAGSKTHGPPYPPGS